MTATQDPEGQGDKRCRAKLDTSDTRVWWLNGDGRTFPGASTQAFCMVGAGGHLVWMEPEHEAVVVVRWLDPAHTNGFLQLVGEALARE